MRKCVRIQVIEDDKKIQITKDNEYFENQWKL